MSWRRIWVCEDEPLELVLGPPTHRIHRKLRDVRQYSQIQPHVYTFRMAQTMDPSKSVTGGDHIDTR
ncbi:uncharacterized protein RAG0_05849 [Rhynchosporium agropyri]|uniref:Uncharacterized protein n=1 Tax=Rhynchosporium agropyri TaxID=914238 RepID=A0A1E1KF03_9HELO|nr:uncharacterized protein RAG0_05849 [Rhynchosporium agropyri]